MKRNTYEINIPHELSQEDIDDILCTAFEGGITHWCQGAEVVEKLPDGKPDYKGASYLNEVLSRGGTIRIYTPKGDWPQEGDKPILSIDKFLKGFEKWAKTEFEHGRSVDTDPSNIDAADSSAIIEMALFGSVVYC